MSSTNKTENLRLNLWEGSDKPMRSDFNTDNQIIEAIITQHLSDSTAHFTGDEKSAIATPFVIGTYVGNGANVRNVSLGFNPKIVIVFTNSVPLTVYDDGKVLAFSAIATSTYCTAGISLIENGMQVIHNTGNPISDNNYACLNKSSSRYLFIAVK